MNIKKCFEDPQFWKEINEYALTNPFLSLI